MKKILIFIAVGLCAMLSHAQQTENRVALVIGNSAYKSSPLKNPVNDASDMSARLKGFGFTVIERNNLTTKQIGSTLREFRSKLTPGSVALVFYAGHGVTIKGKNYLPAVDAEINGEEDVPNQSLGTEQIMDVLAEAKTRLNLVFLDACRDNPYARSFRSTSRGLSRENAPSGTLISFATKPGSVAADGTGRNGLYTSVLLEQIKNSGQPIEQVLKKVVTGVRTASKNQQEPWMEGSIEGDFCFGGCGQTAISQVPAEPTESQKEDNFWNDAKAAGNSKAYEAYLEKYPTGRYSTLAKANIERLSDKPTPPISAPTPDPISPPTQVVSQVTNKWPTSTVRFVVPFAPGGQVDVIARTIAAKLSASMGQTVVIENKSGVGGVLGSDTVAKSKPDGSTFLFTSSNHAFSPSLYKKIPYNPVKDFKPVMLIGTAPLVFVTYTNAPYKSLTDFIGLAKQKPEKFNFGSSSTGGLNHLAMEDFSNSQNIKLNHVPYKGEGPMLIDLIGGQIDIVASTANSLLPHIQSGKLRPLAVSGKKRSVYLPDVPTLGELGLSNTQYLQWWAVFAPVDTPQSLVIKLNQQMSKLLSDPSLRQPLYGIDFEGSSPEVLQEWSLAEMNRWAKVISENKVTLD